MCAPKAFALAFGLKVIITISENGSYVCVIIGCDWRSPQAWHIQHSTAHIQMTCVSALAHDLLGLLFLCCDRVEFVSINSSFVTIFRLKRRYRRVFFCFYSSSASSSSPLPSLIEIVMYSQMNSFDNWKSMRRHHHVITIKSNLQFIRSKLSMCRAVRCAQCIFNQLKWHVKSHLLLSLSSFDHHHTNKR